MAACEVTFIQAEADGVAPALLLKAGGARGAQYLVNVPEGFSRLVLEHHIRPGANLRAILGMHASPESLGGLAGLLMRLRQDGHGLVHLIGPPGTQEALHGLRHFVSWRHPIVHLSQSQPGLPAQIYQDEYVKIAALWGAPLCWTAPGWLQPADNGNDNYRKGAQVRSDLTASAQQTAACKNPEDCNSSDVSSQTSSESQSSDVSSQTSSESQQDDASSRNSSSTSSENQQDDASMSGSVKIAEPSGCVANDTGNADASSVAGARIQPGMSSPNACDRTFEELDRVFSGGGGDNLFKGSGARMRAFKVLGAKRRVNAAPTDATVPVKRKKVADGKVAGRELEPATRGSGLNIRIDNAMDAQLGSGGAMGIGGVTWGQTEGWEQIAGSNNPVFLRSKLASTSAAGNKRLWGLLFHIAATSQNLLFVDCPTPVAFAELLRHPVFQPPRLNNLALVVHLTPRRVAESAAYKRWLTQLSGKQIMMHGHPKEMGFLASARTLAQLNTISSTLFPLPLALSTAGTPKAIGKSIMNARLLMRAVISADGVSLDSESCPPRLNIDDLQREILQERPELSRMAATLKSTSLAESQNTKGPPHRPAPLPDPPAIAQQLGAQQLSAQQLNAQQSRSHRPRRNALRSQRQPGNPQFGTGSWQRNDSSGCQQVVSAKPSSEQHPRMAARSYPEQVGGMAVGQFAQVLQYGRPVGIVQLTPQGWVTPGAFPPLHLAGAFPRTSHVAGMATPYSSPASLQPPTSSATPPQALRTLSEGLQTPLQGLQSRAPPANAVQGGAMQRSQAHAEPRWNAEDIDLPDMDDSLGAGVAESLTAKMGDSSAADVAAGACIEEDVMPVPQCLLDARGDPTQITFLGTGSAEPSKYRASSAIHLQLECGHGVLLDAGEGTLGQLIRCHGRKGAAAQVAQLAAIWISHKHADHMLGLPSILHARPAASAPLLVVGPVAAAKWLADISAPQRLRYRFLACRDCCAHGHPEHQWLLHALGLTEWTAVPVDHCHDAWALVLEQRTGWSLTYSGDSRPCAQLVSAAQGSTILIHEATFDPSLAEQAVQKRHSTTEEALRVAADCGAFRTVLTHFSQRYPRLPPSLAGDSLAGDGVADNSLAGVGLAGDNLSNDKLAGRAVAAFDGMRIPLTALQDLPKVVTVLQYALDKGESLEEDAVKLPDPPRAILKVLPEVLPFLPEAEPGLQCARESHICPAEGNQEEVQIEAGCEGRSQAGNLLDRSPHQSMRASGCDDMDDTEGEMLPVMSVNQTGDVMPLIGLKEQDLAKSFQAERVLGLMEAEGITSWTAAEHAHTATQLQLDRISKGAQEGESGGRILCQHIRFED